MPVRAQTPTEQFQPLAIPECATATSTYTTADGRVIEPGNCGFCDFIVLAVDIARLLLGTSGAVALLVFIWAAFTLTWSGGSAERIEKGKKGLLASIAGLAIVIASWYIVQSFLFVLTTPADEQPRASGDVQVVKILNKEWNRVCE